MMASRYRLISYKIIIKWGRIKLSGVGFDNDKYIRLQSERIRERIDEFGGKLYLEFGGKLFDDNHAARVLPGFKPDSKINMLLNLKEHAEIIIAINADDIENNKQRGDLCITYDMEVIRLIKAFRSKGLYVSSVVITRYHEQCAVEAFSSILAHTILCSSSNLAFSSTRTVTCLPFSAASASAAIIGELPLTRYRVCLIARTSGSFAALFTKSITGSNV